MTRKEMEKVGEIDLSELESRERQKTSLTIVNKFDEEGLVIIDKAFCKTKYRLTPVANCPVEYQEEIEGHPIWKG